MGFVGYGGGGWKATERLLVEEADVNEVVIAWVGSNTSQAQWQWHAPGGGEGWE
jgi:hypothetical protein